MKTDAGTKYKTLEDFVNAVRARGGYSFSREEVKSHFVLSDKALNQALFRYTTKGKIAKVRYGFYAIIPPEYSNHGMLPAELFIDDLMKSLGKRYYVGLFSAAAYHGATHQQSMTYYIVTEKPALRSLKSDKLSLNFYVKKAWHDENIVQKKTDAGYINVSSPELTALDLLTYDFSINRVFTVLEELVEVMKPVVLTRTARNFPQTTSVQRLGYIIDKEIGSDKHTVVLKKVLNEKKLLPIPLQKGEKQRGELDADWKIIKNVDLESDLWSQEDI